MTRIKYFKHSYKYAQVFKFKDHSVVFLLSRIKITCGRFPMRKREKAILSWHLS